MLRSFVGARGHLSSLVVLQRWSLKPFSSSSSSSSISQNANERSRNSSIALTGTASSSSDASSPRSANKYNTVTKWKGKLDQLARPFNQLVDQLLHPDTKTKTTESLAFRIQESDMQAAGAGETTRRLLSLSMQCQSRLSQQLRQQAMNLFCRGPNDTGSPEVQAALWTLKIAALTRHTQTYRHDYVAERRIVEWQDQRRKILKYLKRVSLERYFACVDRLGLPHDLVEVSDPRYPTPPKIRPKSKEGLRKRAHRANQ